MRRPNIVVPIVLALGAVAPVASAATVSKPLNNPCSVVTAADAGRVMGGTAGKGKASVLNGVHMCAYYEGPKMVTAEVSAATRSFFDRIGKAAPPPASHLGGIGNDAYSSAGGQDLMVWKNGTEVYFITAGMKSPLKGLEVAGKAAAGRL